MRARAVLPLVAASFLMAGCARRGEPDAMSAEALRAQAKQLYSVRCQSCHGSAGRGDGPRAATLGRPPRNFTDAGWQHVVTDERLARVIVGGGAANGLSPLMPKNADLRGRDALVSELVALVRSFERRRSQDG